jgi:transcriptional regulator with XRE-family HTH domain
VKGTTLESWINESDDNARLFAEEGLILDASEAVWLALKESEMSKSDLAKLLGTSKANITQLLNGNRNMTLRTLAAIAHALEFKVEVRFSKDENKASFEQFFQIVRRRSPHEFRTLDSANMSEWKKLEKAA